MGRAGGGRGGEHRRSASAWLMSSPVYSPSRSPARAGACRKAPHPDTPDLPITIRCTCGCP